MTHREERLAELKYREERLAELKKARDSIQDILREAGAEIKLNVRTDQLRVTDARDDLSDMEVYFEPPYDIA